MTPVDALLVSARVVGWLLVPASYAADPGVVLVRRVGARVDLLTFTSATGNAVVASQLVGGAELWRHEVPVNAALAWATGEFDDDAPLAALAGSGGNAHGVERP